MRRVVKIIAVTLMFLPGFLILGNQISTSLGEEDPLLFGILLLFGGIIGFLSWLCFLNFEVNKRIKIFASLGALAVMILTFPSSAAIESIKQSKFIDSNRQDLELLAEKILNSEISVEDGNDFLESQNIKIKIMNCDSMKDGNVLFLINGMMDNCSGFAYSKIGKRANENCCGGKLISWDNIEGKWFKWTTI